MKGWDEEDRKKGENLGRERKKEEDIKEWKYIRLKGIEKKRKEEKRKKEN